MAEHGGNVEKIANQLNVKKEDLIDFSANINPFGMPNNIKQILLHTIKDLEHYPDVEYNKSRQAIAKYEQMDMAHVVLSNGAVQLFFELAVVLKPKNVLLLAPTFLEYAEAFSRMDTTIHYYHLEQQNYFQINLDNYMQHMSCLSSGDALVICNPNNPTGTLLTHHQIEQIVKRAEQKGVFVILDEAFIDFVENESQFTFVRYLAQYDNVCITKSLTKFFAIPGIRLGYALTTNTMVLNKLKTYMPPWSVNAFANAIVESLFHDSVYIEKTKQWIVEEKVFLYQKLNEIPYLSVVKPSVNYIFFKCNKPIDLRARLYRENILIRSCANYPTLNDTYYRVAIKSREDNMKLLNALQRILNEDTLC